MRGRRRLLLQAAGAVVPLVFDASALRASFAATPIQVQGPPAEPVLPRAVDLRRDAEQVRRQRKPLLLFFSTPGCPYCREVRRGYLAPRAAQPETDVLIREIDITSARSFVGIDGVSQTEADFAAGLRVRLVPVVRLVDDRLAPLGEPLIGFNESFYDAYLQGAIDDARRKLAAR